MNVDLIPLTKITAEMHDFWLRVVQANPSLRGPCFHPEFFRQLARFRDDMYLLVFSAKPSDSITAMIPVCYKASARVLSPISGCDYQFIITDTENPLPILDILRRLKLAVWDVEHFVGFEQYQSVLRRIHPMYTYLADIRTGLDAYKRDMSERHTNFKRMNSFQRKVEREVGPLRFVANETSVTVLENGLQWRKSRYNVEDSAEYQAFTRCLKHLLNFSEEGFSTKQSALFAGDTLLACQFGLVSDGILYWWIPAFNPNLSRYSPGRIFVYTLISNLAETGCTVLDFGPGTEVYKPYFANRTVSLASGSFETSSVLSIRRDLHAWYRATGRKAKDVARRSLKSKVPNSGVEND
jgi:hypothetical protein